MKSTCLPCLLLLAAGACDLPELRQGQRDAGSDAGLPPPDDAGEPADAGQDGGPIDPFADPAIPPGAALGSCRPSRWTVTASESAPFNPPEYAVDGLAPTRWSTGSPQSAGQYFQVDFGGFVKLDGLSIRTSFADDGVGDYPRAVDVLISYDGGFFSPPLASASPASDPGPVFSLQFPAHAARFVRLQLNLGVGNWWTMHELVLGCAAADGGSADAGPDDAGVDDGGSSDAGLNPNRAAWTATANFTNPFDPVGNAFDGDLGTRWTTGKLQSGDETFRLDLGQVVSLRQVWLTSSAADYPSAYRLSLSSDGATFTSVATGLGSEDLKVAFPRHDARYVKIEQLGSGYDHWWGINELTVVP